MRELVAGTVKSQPEMYSEALLGKPNKDYCKWIQLDDSWGGAIEIAILSSYYGLEIDVVDTQNAIINKFGEDQNYGQRILLIYDGIHYDPLYLEPFSVIFAERNCETCFNFCNFCYRVVGCKLCFQPQIFQFYDKQRS